MWNKCPRDNNPTKQQNTIYNAENTVVNTGPISKLQSVLYMALDQTK